MIIKQTKSRNIFLKMAGVLLKKDKEKIKIKIKS